MSNATTLEDDSRSVGFHEKFAWVMALALALSILIILWVMLPVSGWGMEALRPPVAVALIMAVIVQTLIAIIGATISALTNLEDANAPADERDRRLRDQAGRPALALTQLGLLLSLLSFIMGAGTAPLLLGLVLSLHLGELVRLVGLIGLYRSA